MKVVVMAGDIMVRITTEACSTDALDDVCNRAARLTREALTAHAETVGVTADDETA